jgi:uncharacterized membrane protein YhaH (DUF805 family)
METNTQEPAVSLNPFDCNRRIGRAAYAVSLVALIVVGSVIARFFASVQEKGPLSGFGGFCASLAAALLLLFLFVQSAKRCNDIGGRRWWAFAALVPYVQIFPWIFLLAKPGTAAENRFGPAIGPEAVRKYVALMWFLGMLGCLLIAAGIFFFVALFHGLSHMNGR